MSQDIIQLIETCVLAPLLTAMTGVIIAFLHRQSERLKTKIANEKANSYIDLADGIVRQAVTSVSQTFVDGLKKEGKFDSDAQKEAFEKSKTLVYALMKSECKKAIEENYISFDKWLETKIEEAVNKINKG